ncbi:hypothetical protein BIW11_03016 [Tropilaelaps mercedesae]|uniref:Uncharacterized protein n=1 Tax=Tropilaelaps mercedesae TaxID=418985 RepID=A0A1V9XTG0_9ACAR|nr:hypothetical protein BIW11_03016 [Tropilaelaps mercedesae]
MMSITAMDTFQANLHSTLYFIDIVFWQTFYSFQYRGIDPHKKKLLRQDHGTPMLWSPSSSLL